MPRKPYVSDTTEFIRDLLAKKPHIVEEQRKGRAMWWDRKLDQDELVRNQQSKVAQKGYVYQTD